MSLKNRVLNQVVRLSAQDPEPQDSNEQTTTPQFTSEQWATILEALELEADATTDEVVESITTIAEEVTKITNGEETKVAASAQRPGVYIDAEVWDEMQRNVKLGLRQTNQKKRLEAEQVVDQAIRLGRCSPTHREHWIQEYHLDPEGTTRRLANGKEIPRFEIGYGRMPEDFDDNSPTGWVK